MNFAVEPDALAGRGRSQLRPTGSHALVFVDKGEGALEPRFVQIGRKYGDVYDVLDGLKEGERVVASANFLIDAESNLRAALQGFADGAHSQPAQQGATP